MIQFHPILTAVHRRPDINLNNEQSMLPCLKFQYDLIHAHRVQYHTTSPIQTNTSLQIRSQGHLHRLTGSVVSPRYIANEFKARPWYVRGVFQLSFRLIIFGGRSAHLAFTFFFIHWDGELLDLHPRGFYFKHLEVRCQRFHTLSKHWPNPTYTPTDSLLATTTIWSHDVLVDETATNGS